MAIAICAAELSALPADREISQYVRHRWTVEEGLPHGTVRGFAQTADGYLWLATYEGLVRFNGERFLVYDKETAPGIPNSSILTVHRTRDDTLWLGTAAGLVRYRAGAFLTIERPPGVPEELVNAVQEAPDGTVWVGTWGTLSHVSGDRLMRVPLPAEYRLINALLPDADGGLWIGTSGGGLAHRTRDGLVAYGTSQGLLSDTVLTLLPDGADGVLVGTTSGLNRIVKGGVERVAGLPVDQVTALERDREGNVWVGTYSNGLFRMNGSSIAAYGISDGLLNPTVRGIFEDDEGSLWVGTNRGLEQMRTGTFTSWNESSGIADNFTRAVFEDRDGIIWVGTAHGLSRGENGRWTRFSDPKLATAYVLSIEQDAQGTLWFGTSNGLYRHANGRTTVLTTADGLSSNGVRALHAQGNGVLWIASDSGINRLLPDGRVEKFDGGGLGTNYAIAIVEADGVAGPGTIWVATGGGLAEFDGTSFRLHSAPATLPSNRLFALDADADGTLWIGTDGEGLVRFRRGRADLITTRQGLAYDKILSIADDENGNLWLGTVRGAFRAAKRDLHAIADGRNVRLEPSLYDENDGLGSRQCNGSGSPAALRTRDGRIWFATANGVSALAAGRREGSPVTPRQPVVERVLVNGGLVAPRALANLAPGTDRIDLEFTGVTFVAPERLRFRYRLEGYDDKWIDAGTNRVASYTNLPAGKYRFYLGSSRDGRNWRVTGVPIGLRPYFYEQRWFIALSVVTGLSLLLALHLMRLHLSRQRAAHLQKIVDERTRQIREEKERTEEALRATEAAKREVERQEQLAEAALAHAEEANRAKSIFLAATSHELRTPLNAIIGFSDILILRAEGQLDARFMRFLHNIHSSGAYLLGIINNILDLSKIEAGRMEMRPELISLADTLDGVSAVMKGVTALKKIRLDLHVPEDLPAFEADPVHMKQILYNLIANAVKFSPEHSTVTVSARLLASPESSPGRDAIEISVSDEGVGIDPKDHQLIFQEFRQLHEQGNSRPEGTGLGLALVKRFVELHGGTIQVRSALGEGSTFFVVMPLRQAAATAAADDPVAETIAG